MTNKTELEAVEAGKYWLNLFIEQYENARITHETDGGEAAFVIEKEHFDALKAHKSMFINAVNAYKAILEMRGV